MLASEVLFYLFTLLLFYLFTFSLFYNDWLVLRNQYLHDAPTNEVSNTTDAEYNHVSTRLAVKSHEAEGRTLPLCVGEEHTRTLVDKERTDTTSHCTNTSDCSNS